MTVARRVELKTMKSEPVVAACRRAADVLEHVALQLDQFVLMKGRKRAPQAAEYAGMLGSVAHAVRNPTTSTIYLLSCAEGDLGRMSGWRAQKLARLAEEALPMVRAARKLIEAAWEVDFHLDDGDVARFRDIEVV